MSLALHYWIGDVHHECVVSRDAFKRVNWWCIVFQ